MDAEEYKKLIIDIVAASQDIEYLIAVYTFALHYPNQGEKGNS